MIGDDKIAKQNYSVARVVTHNRNDIEKFERHIERKNDNYANKNIDLSNLIKTYCLLHGVFSCISTTIPCISLLNIK